MKAKMVIIDILKKKYLDNEQFFQLVQKISLDNSLQI